MWDGAFTQEGLQSGGTLWAKDVRSIIWGHDIIAHLRTHQGTKISVIKLWKLDKQKGDQ